MHLSKHSVSCPHSKQPVRCVKLIRNPIQDNTRTPHMSRYGLGHGCFSESWLKANSILIRSKMDCRVGQVEGGIRLVTNVS